MYTRTHISALYYLQLVKKNRVLNVAYDLKGQLKMSLFAQIEIGFSILISFCLIVNHLSCSTSGRDLILIQKLA